MMQAFFKTHKFLLDHLNVPIRRGMMDKINWDDRLIGILGARGVGKTNFLLDYVNATYGFDKACLYVNLNNLYFSERTIISFADEFQKTGGERLILDQVFKYPGWMDELIYCYDNFPGLKIVFSGSPLMYNAGEELNLNGRAAIYTLEGFSFREFVNHKTNGSFKAVSLDDILNNHERIAASVVEKVKPLAYYNDYLHHGYYPFFLEKSNYLENLVKNINLVLEIDISYLQQIELKYLPKLRKLLYLIACSAPFQPNVSRLSAEVETSRATIINYLKYLKQAKLIHLLYEGNTEMLKKPSEIYMQNPNLLYSVGRGDVEQEVLNKTFFCNQVAYRHRVGYNRNVDFTIEGKYLFNVGRRVNGSKSRLGEVWHACEMMEVGSGRDVPLWLFGFLD
ncbi:AAA family ATPase [Alkaliflexus imshenetskii]|uniref:AAA family ATPase n=1 Tax=Alkaliflexus imshenetskii TaxID=286730 RepID=UPI0004B14CC7|nr:AAA family ATPase [Alkaliflexus imshenetskii]